MKLAPSRRLTFIACTIAAVLLCLRMFGCAESHTFYMPSREPFSTPPRTEDVWITMPSGAKLHAWYMLPARAPDSPDRSPAILHVHGNAGNIASHEDFSRFLTSRGIGVLIFDYRGYGKSDPISSINRNTCMADTRAAFDYLLTRPDIDPKRVGVYGVSLGSTFALALASERPEPRAVCTVSAFSSWSAVANDHVPLLGGFLIPGGLDPATSAAGLGPRPYLIVHGANDDIVYPYHADRLESAAKGAGVNVSRLTIPNASHNDVIFNGSEPQEHIAGFFAKNLSPM